MAEGKTSNAPSVESTDLSTDSVPSGGGSGGGGGYSGGGGSSGPDTSDLQEQLNFQKNMYNKANADLQKTLQDSLQNVDRQRQANAQQLLMKNAQINRKSEWQPNQQKEQSTYAALRKTMGNAAYGSGLADLNEGMARFDDMQDVSLINTWKENQDNAYNSWYQANSDLITDYNDKVIEGQQKFNDLYNEYANNVANINAEIANRQMTWEQDKVKQNSELAALISKAQTRLDKLKGNKKKNAKAIKKLRTQINKAVKAANGATYNANKVSFNGKKYNLTTKKGRKSYNKAIKKSAKTSNYTKAITKALKTATKNAKNLSKGVIKVDGLKVKAVPQISKQRQNLVNNNILTTRRNIASPNNPNIPDSAGGATDYIRGANETVRSRGLTDSRGNALSVGKPKTSSAANQQYWDNSNRNQQWYRAAQG